MGADSKLKSSQSVNIIAGAAQFPQRLLIRVWQSLYFTEQWRKSHEAYEACFDVKAIVQCSIHDDGFGPEACTAGPITACRKWEKICISEIDNKHP